MTPDTAAPGGALPDTAALSAAREALRTGAPLVHCLTNTVVQTITANVLLAIGAAPAMVDAPEEAGDFAAIASAVLVNVGTVHARTAQAMRLAAREAGDAERPWVLDPVAVGGLAYRTHLARDLVQLGPTVVRGNASEVLALAGAGAGGRGVDSTAGAEEAAGAAAALARRTGGVVAVSGAVDVITDGTRTVRVGGGSELLTRTTGAGCALGAVVAAYLAVTDDPLTATVAAHAHVALAAEVAADLADGPGTFAAQWVDALDALDGDALARADLRG
jgi:hydroxyethylthiazole kinase